MPVFVTTPVAFGSLSQASTANLDSNFLLACSSASGYAETVAGTANAIVLTIPLALTQLYYGMQVRFLGASPNTSTVTLSVNGLETPYPVLTKLGVALAANAILTGGLYTVVLGETATSATAWYLL